MKLIFALFALFILSCNSEALYPTHKLLIESKSEFLFPDNGEIDRLYGSVQEFERQSLKVNYLNDTIFAEVHQDVNSCGKSKANIIVFGDTIYLISQELSNTVCASQDWYKYQYWISNPKNKKFVILKR